MAGGGSRLGAEISRALSEAGAAVVVHAFRSLGEAETLAAGLPTRAIALGADLRDPAAPAALFDRAAERGLQPDLLVHAAASFLRKPALETSAAEWDEVQALNLRSLFLLGTELARRRGEAGGDIIAIADTAAVELWPSHVAHAVSKAGVVALVRALAKALAPRYRVNAVMPGPVLPPEGTSAAELHAYASRTLLQRIGAPHHVVRAVLFLAECDFATGTVVEVHGGSPLWRGRVHPLPEADRVSPR